jgi:hypothetical protein
MGASVPKRTTAGNVLALLVAPFRDASQMSDFNSDEKAFYQETFFSNCGGTQLLYQEGRETRNNPSRLRSYLKKTFKK